MQSLKWLKFLGHLLIKIPSPFGFELNQHLGFIILQYMLIQVWDKHGLGSVIGLHDKRW